MLPRKPFVGLQNYLDLFDPLRSGAALRGRIEAVLPPPEQVPGEVYAHGSRLKCRVVSVGRGQRTATVTRASATTTPGSELVR